jgi:two-component sensor histidine kinase
VIGDNGEIIAIIGTGHDISDRMKAEEELRLRLETISKSEQILMQNEKRLSDTLAEKEVLLAEIHHRVKNNLTAFISLLSLDDSYDKSPDGQRLRIELMNRARSMALIHETLFKTKKYSIVDMGIYVSSLVEHIAATAEPGRAVHTIVEAEGVTLDIARATPCGMIISELVTNAFRYAFPASFDCMIVRNEPCTVRISLYKDNEAYELRISDNGVGLPEGLDVATTTSLGLKLVRFLARHQLRATVTTGTDQGTEFTIRFTGSTGGGKTPAPGK